MGHSEEWDSGEWSILENGLLVNGILGYEMLEDGILMNVIELKKGIFWRLP